MPGMQYLRRVIQRHPVVSAAAAAALVWGLIGFDLWRIYRLRLEAAQEQVQAAARTVEERVRRTVRAVDLGLQDIAAGIARLPGPPERMAGEVRRLLSSRGNGDAFSLFVFDAAGMPVAASRPLSGPARSYAERDYFAAQRAAPDGVLHVGVPLVGRGDGERLFSLSRRITAGDGRFLGVVMASVDAGDLAALFETLRVGEHGSIGLYHLGSQTTVAYQPDFAGHFGQAAAEGVLAETVAALPTGIAYRPLAGLPLAVRAAAAPGDVVAAWRRDVAGYAGFGVLITAAMLLAVRRMSRAATGSPWNGGAGAAHQLAVQVFESSAEGIVITDHDNRIVSVNRAFEEITGYGFEEVRGHDPKLLASGVHDGEFYGGMWDALVDKGRWEGEVWDRRKSGEIYPKWLRITLVRDQASGRTTNHVAIFSDITDRKRVEQRIHHLAHHDALTALPNRLALHNCLEPMLAMAWRQGRRLAVMFIDLDRFKNINDSLGHHVGDRLLVEVARRIAGVVRQSDLVARLGGDEFVVVVQDSEEARDAALVAQKILDRLALPFAMQGRQLHSGASIGISVFPADGRDIDALMRNADLALYHAKSKGRGGYQFYAPAMNQAVADFLSLETRLRRALAQDDFVLHYQPQVRLASDRVDGLEALLRWNDPEQGLIMPGAFIQVAEESGLIVALGEWVLRQACVQARVWSDAGLAFRRVSVNISPHQFRRDDFVDTVRRVLAETGTDPRRIELEITETTVMETADASVEVLQKLRSLGLSLAIDDFGTGYSSLSYLKLLPIDRLKIDRSFVLDIERDPNAASIASAVIALAHSIGLQVVAEGAETDGQMAFLRQHGCDVVQGYHFSRPLPVDAAGKFLRLVCQGEVA